MVRSHRPICTSAHLLVIERAREKNQYDPVDPVEAKLCPVTSTRSAIGGQGQSVLVSFSIDKGGTYCKMKTVFAGIAQLVEPHVANVIVAGSSPVSRSNSLKGSFRKRARG